MPDPDLSLGERLQRLDRFLHWDLVTVTPWGAPAISPVGARLLPGDNTIWTSTTVGYATKLRNIRGRPQVCLLRARPGGEPLLLRGLARIQGGDGTANLAMLFRLMGGPGGSRAFFAASATNPFWRRLYRAYWRRVLVAVEVVEACILEEDGWRPVAVQPWATAAAAPPRPGHRRRSGLPERLLQARGRALIGAGAPVVLAALVNGDRAPWAWPVQATLGAQGEILVDGGGPIPSGRLLHASLAVRVVDDTFETAQMVGWIGTLEEGDARRRFSPRSAYGFVKPPGVVGDLGAGMAALIGQTRVGAGARVSSPDLERAVELAGGAEEPVLLLPQPIWELVEEVFSRRNAAAPWYSTMAALSQDPQARARLTVCAQRAELERDWAHGLLSAGRRRVGAVRLARGAIALRPNPGDPAQTRRREEPRVRELLQRLERRLPSDLRPPPRQPIGPQMAAAGGVGLQELAGALLTTAGATAAALDRMVGPGRS